MLFCFSSCHPRKKKAVGPERWPPSPFLAEGGFSRVYGPYTVHQLEPAYRKWTGHRLPPLPSDRSYIAKFYLHHYRNKNPKENEMALWKKVVQLQSSYPTPRILVPRVLTHTRRKRRLEIQEYGGREFTKFVYDNDELWTDDRLWTLWLSILEILSIGTRLIEDHDLFLLDIKPENMVYTHLHGLSLIDVEYVPQETIFQGDTQNLVYTWEWLPPFPTVEWTRSLVRPMAMYSLFYPLAILWKSLRVVSSTSKVRFRMNQLMDHGLQQGLDLSLSLPLWLSMMKKVCAVDYPVLWKEYTAGMLKTPEDVDAVWISDKKLVFPPPRLEPFLWIKDYF